MDLGVYCLNVGQGSCAVVIDEIPNRPGSPQAVLLDVGVDGDRLVRWLRAAGVVRIPLIALSHNDADHIIGLEQVVCAFRRRIDKVRFVVDRPTQEIPFWVDAQRWAGEGIIGSVGQLDTPLASRPGMGNRILEPPQVSYRLHCAYPDVFQNYAAVTGAQTAGPRPDRGPNATSAVLRLARTTNPDRTRVLFGGDLNLPGWQCLVHSGHRLKADVLIAPHHGAPRGATAEFGYADLADAVKPRFVVFSAGTRQKHVTKRTEATARHPLPEMVRAFRQVDANVLCTQMTRRCVDDPEALPGRSVLPLEIADGGDLSPSGARCAGAVVISIGSATGRLTVADVAAHRVAVDDLNAGGHHPLCRP